MSSKNVIHSIALIASVVAGAYLGYKLTEYLAEPTKKNKTTTQKYIEEIDKAISSTSTQSISVIARALTIGLPIIFWSILSNFIWVTMQYIFPILNP